MPKRKQSDFDIDEYHKLLADLFPSNYIVEKTQQIITTDDTYITLIKEQIDYIVEDLVDFTKILPREINTTVKNTVSMIQFPDMREYDEKVEMKNKELVKSTSALVGSVTIMGFSLVYAMSKKYDFDFMDMMKKNLIVLFFVGITGFMFVRFIAKNFRSGDPNHVKKYILTVFKKVSQ